MVPHYVNELHHIINEAGTSCIILFTFEMQVNRNDLERHLGWTLPVIVRAGMWLDYPF